MSTPYRRHCCHCQALLAGTAIALTSLSRADDNMLELSLEQLMDMDVTVSSASKSEEKVIDVPSAIYVISQKDIRRAGISTIPEALRMAPGLHVAQINSNEWAVSSRGLNGRYSRYLLVLIDGRSVYSSMFSGVNWDEHNLIMGDIDRIEVIRGPGATVWSANAVNGVINIITRAPDENDHTTLTLRGGIGEKAHLSGAHSDKWGKMSYRLSAQHSEIEGLYSPTLSRSENDWRNSRLSWQANIDSEASNLKLYADIAQTVSHALWPIITPGSPLNSIVAPREEKNQYSLQAHWKRQFSEQDTLDIQISTDQTKRRSTFSNWETRNNDAELLWARSQGKAQFHLGFNYRWTLSKFITGDLLSGYVIPDEDNIELYSAFAQLQYQLLPNVETTFGVKLESHSETGDNLQPSARAIWAPSQSQRWWISASKAISTPSRIITDSSRIDIIGLAHNELPTDIVDSLTSVGLGGLPVNVSIENRGRDIENTELIAYELGYRFQWHDTFTLELALFNNEYKNLVSSAILLPELAFSPAPYVNFPIQYCDDGIADARGVELNVSWKVTSDWLLQYSASYINFDPSFEINDGIQALERLSISEDTPTTQHSVRSHHNLSEKINLDFWIYHYGNMKNSEIDDFTSLNFRLEWRPDHNLSLALLGKNLIDSNRTEFYREIFYTGDFQVQKTVNLEVQWSFD